MIETFVANQNPVPWFWFFTAESKLKKYFMGHRAFFAHKIYFPAQNQILKQFKINVWELPIVNKCTMMWGLASVFRYLWPFVPVGPIQYTANTLVSNLVIVTGSLSSSEGLYPHHWVFIIISVTAGFCHRHRWVIFVVINNILEGGLLEKSKRKLDCLITHPSPIHVHQDDLFQILMARPALGVGQANSCPPTPRLWHELK